MVKRFGFWVVTGLLSILALVAGCGGGGDASGEVAAPSAAASDRAKALAAPATTTTPVAPSVFSSYEAAHVHPMDMTPDGALLLSVNTANGTLEVFDASGAAVTLKTAIKVGMDPVTVRAASNTEAWVVNVLSDSVSIVDLASGTVKATLATDDEPADVVFAGSPRRAYVSCAQARTLLVVDPAAPTTVLTRIPIQGQQPRALATSADGSKVYLAIFESGNGTTALSGKNNGFEQNALQDPAGPYGGVNPPPNANNGTTFNPPMNPANPPPPNQLSLIVRRTASGDWLDDNGRSWKGYVNGSLTPSGAKASTRAAGWDLIDRDVAIVDTATQAVSYQGGLMNIVMAMAVNPTSGQITVVGTDATNQIRFEPVLDGTFLKVLFAGFQPGGSNVVKDMNPHLSYTSSSIAMSERLKSIGDPRGIAWNAAGSKAYVTGLGSNNLIVLDAQGNRAGINPTINVGQGPTGVVLQEAQKRAFVLNRFDATISIVDLTSETVLGTVALSYDPTPQVIKDGRPMLYDTHRFSGLGQISCASCHVDGKTDRLAWDLGNPAGDMVTSGGVQHHPMKGPLLTQTLVDTMQSPFLHWRGDRPDLSHFSAAFQTLQGADVPATSDEIAKMLAFLQTLRTPPNPYRNLDNSYPTSLSVPGPRNTVQRVGNAAAGAQEFEANCRSCHPGQTGRGTLVRNLPEFSGGNYLNPPKWQNFYRRDGLYFFDATGSTAGFGYQPDGTFDSTHNNSRSDNMMAFMYSFNGSFPYVPAGLNATNTAVDSPPAVGQQVTLTATATTAPLLTQLLTLADSKNVGLVASGCVNNERRGYVYTGSGNFQADRVGETTTLAALQAVASLGAPVTFTAVRLGTETRIGIDQDGDGILDGAQGLTPIRACTSGTLPDLALGKSASQSSTILGGDASRATDGNTDGNWADNSVTHTDFTAQPWLQVDLGQLQAITAVQLFNRTDCCVDRLSNFYVFVSTSDMSGRTLADLAADATVAKVQVASLYGAPSITLPLSTQGRYVKVQLAGTNNLNLAEVRVVGLPGSTLTNLAAHKAATQSSSNFGGDPNRAVDGNTDGNWVDNSVSHTDITAQPWWQVDLGQVYAVQSVQLFNRTDCCSDRLSNFIVFLSTSDMSSQTLAQLNADATVTKVSVASLNGATSISLPLQGQGRYVRVQLTGTNYLSLAEVQVMGTPAPVTPGLAASYFNNNSLSGTPALQRTENVDFNWGAGSPDPVIPVDYFSARWTGYLQPATTGKYNFATLSDDGVRVWINGTLVIDDWTLHGPTTDIASAIQLTAGQRYSVRIEYFEQTGGATMRWQWQVPGSTSYVAVPAAVLYAN